MGIAVLVLAIMVAAMGLGMSQVRKRLGKEAARQGVIRVAPFIVLTFALIVLSQREGAIGNAADNTVQIILPLGLAALEWAVLLTWPVRKRRAGKVEEDLGPHPARAAMWWLVISCVLSASATIVESVGKGIFDWRTLGAETFLFSSAIAALVVARSRVHITERGYLRFDLRFTWEQIESWKFERGGTLDVLRLRVRTNIPWGRTLLLEMEPGQRPVVEKWLATRAAPSEVESVQSPAEPYSRSVSS
ncbi:MAG: hypothetical protein WEE89_08510 [Gemmatimonadota bacterium]